MFDDQKIFSEEVGQYDFVRTPALKVTKTIEPKKAKKQAPHLESVKEEIKEFVAFLDTLEPAKIEAAKKESVKVAEQNPDVQRWVTVIFPSLNKNNTLVENYEAMALYGTNSERCKILKTVDLDAKMFKEVSNSLLENRAELWQQIGGSASDAPELENVTYVQLQNDKNLMQIFRKTGYVMVVEVKNRETGKTFFVNTEGYDYARYVGVRKPDTEIEEVKMLGAIPANDQNKDDNTVQIGSVFVHSWGYEQTNVDFYEVVAMTGKTVTIREISQNRKETGFLCGTCTPDKGNYTGEPMQKRLNLKYSEPSIKISSYGWCPLYKGGDQYWSAYA